MNFVYNTTDGLVSYGNLTNGITNFVTDDRVLVNTGRTITQLGQPSPDTVVYCTSDNKYIWSKVNTSGFNYLDSNRVGIATFNGSNVKIIPTPSSMYSVIMYNNSDYTLSPIMGNVLVPGTSINSVPKILYNDNNDLRFITAKHGVLKYTNSNSKQLFEFDTITPVLLTGNFTTNVYPCIPVATTGGTFTPLQPTQGLVYTTSKGFFSGIPKASNITTTPNNGLMYVSNDNIFTFAQPSSADNYVIKFNSNGYVFEGLNTAFQQNITPKILNSNAKTVGTQLITNSSNTFGLIDSSIGFLYCNSNGKIIFDALYRGITNFNSNVNGLIFNSGLSLFQTDQPSVNKLIVYSNDAYAWSTITTDYLTMSSVIDSNYQILFANNKQFGGIKPSPGVNTWVYNSTTKTMTTNTFKATDIVINANTSIRKHNQIVYYDTDRNQLKSIPSTAENQLLTCIGGYFEWVYIDLQYMNVIDDNKQGAKNCLLVTNNATNKLKKIPQPTTDNTFNFVFYNKGEYALQQVSFDNIGFPIDTISYVPVLSSSGSLMKLSAGGDRVLVSNNSNSFAMSKLDNRYFTKTSTTTGIWSTQYSDSTTLNLIEYNPGVLTSSATSSKFMFPTPTDLLGSNTVGLVYTNSNKFFIASTTKGIYSLNVDNNKVITFTDTLQYISTSLKPAMLNSNAKTVGTQLITNSSNTFGLVDSSVGFLYCDNKGNIAFDALYRGISDFNSGWSGLLCNGPGNLGNNIYQVEQAYVNKLLIFNSSNFYKWSTITVDYFTTDTAFDSNFKMLYTLNKKINGIAPSSGVNTMVYNSSTNAMTLKTFESKDVVDTTYDSSDRLVVANNDKLVTKALGADFSVAMSQNNSNAKTIKWNKIGPKSLAWVGGTNSFSNCVLVVNNDPTNQFKKIPQPPNKTYNLIYYEQGGYTMARPSPSNLSFVVNSNVSTLPVVTKDNKFTSLVPQNYNVVVSTNSNTFNVTKLNQNYFTKTATNSGIYSTDPTTNTTLNLIEYNPGVLTSSATSSKFMFPTPTDLLGSNTSGLVYTNNNAFKIASTSAGVYSLSIDADLNITFKDAKSQVIDSFKPGDVIPGLDTTITQVIVSDHNSWNVIGSSVGFLYTDKDSNLSWSGLDKGITNFNADLQSIVMYNSTSSTFTQFAGNFEKYKTLVSNETTGFAWTQLTPGYFGITETKASLMVNTGANNVLKTIVPTPGLNYLSYDSKTNSLSFMNNNPTLYGNTSNTSNPVVLYAKNNNWYLGNSSSDLFTVLGSNMDFTKVKPGHLDGISSADTGVNGLVYIDKNAKFKYSPNIGTGYNAVMHYDGTTYTQRSTSNINGILPEYTKTANQVILVSNDGNSLEAVSYPGNTIQKFSSGAYLQTPTLCYDQSKPKKMNFGLLGPCHMNLTFNGYSELDTSIPLMYNYMGVNDSNTKITLQSTFTINNGGCFSSVFNGLGGLFFYKHRNSSNGYQISAEPMVSTTIPAYTITPASSSVGALVFADTNGNLSWINPPTKTGSFCLTYDKTKTTYVFNDMQTGIVSNIKPADLYPQASTSAKQIIINNSNEWDTVSGTGFLYNDSNPNTLRYTTLSKGIYKWKSNWSYIVGMFETSGYPNNKPVAIDATTTGFNVLLRDPTQTIQLRAGKIGPQWLDYSGSGASYSATSGNYESTSRLIYTYKHKFVSVEYPKNSTFLFRTNSNSEIFFSNPSPWSLMNINSNQVQLVTTSSNKFIGYDLTQGIMHVDANKLVSFTPVYTTDLSGITAGTNSLIAMTSNNSSFTSIGITSGVCICSDTNAMPSFTTIDKTKYLVSGTPARGIIYNDTSGNIRVSNNSLHNGEYHVIQATTTGGLELYNITTTFYTIEPKFFGYSETAKTQQLIWASSNNSWVFKSVPTTNAFLGWDTATSSISYLQGKDTITNFDSKLKTIVTTSGSTLQQLAVTNADTNKCLHYMSNTGVIFKFIQPVSLGFTNVSAGIPFMKSDSSWSSIPAVTGTNFIKYDANGCSMVNVNAQTLTGVSNTKFGFITATNNVLTNSTINDTGYVYYNSNTKALSSSLLTANTLQWGISNSNSIMVYVDSNSKFNALNIPINNTNVIINYNAGVYSFNKINPNTLFATPSNSNTYIISAKNNEFVNVITSNNAVLRCENNSVTFSKVKPGDCNTISNSGIVCANSNTNSFVLSAYKQGLVNANDNGLVIGIPSSVNILQNNGIGIVYNNGNYLYSTDTVYASGAYIPVYESSKNSFKLTKMDSSITNLNLPTEDGIYGLVVKNGAYSWVVSGFPTRFFAIVSQNQIFTNGVIQLGDLINNLNTIDYPCKITMKYILNIPNLIDMTNEYFQTAIAFGSYDESGVNPVFTPTQILNTFTFNMYKTNMFTSVIYYDPEEFKFSLASIAHVSDISATSVITNTTLELNKSTITSTLKLYSIEMDIERI